MGHLVLDIETIPDLDIWTPEPKKKRKNAKAVETPPPGFESAEPEEKPFAPIWAHKVIVVGCVKLDDNGIVQAIGTYAGDDECDNIYRWSRLMSHLSIKGTEPGFGDPRVQPLKLVSWYGRGFDLPVLQARAFIHGIPLAWYWKERFKYRYDDTWHTDLCDCLSDFGATRDKMKLDYFAKAVGLPGKGDVDGSMVEEMHKAGKLAQIAAYCTEDIVQTAFLFLRWRLLKGKLDKVGFERATEALLEECRKLNLPIVDKIDVNRLLRSYQP
jgi:hypothetical protein